MKDPNYERLKKEIKNYNQRVSRAKLKHNNKDFYIPEKVKISDFIKEGKPVDDFDYKLKKIQSFYQKTLDKQISYSDLSYDDLTELQKAKIKPLYKESIEKINQRARERKDRAGMVDEQPVYGMGNIRDSRYRERKDLSESLSQREMWRSIQAIENELKEGRENIYKENYLYGLSHTHGLGEGDELYDFVNMLDANDLYDMWVNNPELQLDFIYEVKEGIAPLIVQDRIYKRMKEWLANKYTLNPHIPDNI